MCTTFLGSLRQELKDRPEQLAGETEEEEIYCGWRDQIFALGFAGVWEVMGKDIPSGANGVRKGLEKNPRT